jgi:acetyltransferase-like isoleucine patch superfamily enzyme
MDATLSNSTWERFKKRLQAFQEKLLIAALGTIPFFIGKILRRFFYGFILAGIKNSSEIAAGVIFHNPGTISLGDGVRIESFVRFLNFGSVSEIYLHDHVVISQHVEIRVHAPKEENSKVEIGTNTYIGPYSYLSGKNISIGKNCLIGPYVGIFANNHVFQDPNRPIREQGHTYKGIVIEDDCWIGTGTKILDGIRIGFGSVVGAGSVVTKDLPSYSVAAGVPARIIKMRNQALSVSATLADIADFS